MDWRRIGQGLALAAWLALPGRAAAGSLHEFNVGIGQTYTTLEQLRTSLPALSAGDEVNIYLYNDDNSLTEGFYNSVGVNSGGVVFNLHSVGGRHSVSSVTAQPIFSLSDDVDDSYVPGFSLENVRFANKPTAGIQGVIDIGTYYPGGSARSEVWINNSIFENNGNGLGITGNIDVGIVNSIFRNNGDLNSTGRTNVIQASNSAGEETNINIAIDATAPHLVSWDSELAGAAMELAFSGSGSLNVDVAANRKLAISGAINGGIGTLLTPDSINRIGFNKTGAGVLKLRSGTSSYRSTQLTPNGFDTYIHEGTLHFGDKSFWNSSGILYVAPGATFKPSITPGNLVEQHILGKNEFTANKSLFALGSFYSEPGSRLEVGGISLMPDIGPQSAIRGTSRISDVWMGLIAGLDTSFYGNSGIASMSVDNRLMTAALEFYKTSDLTGTPDLTKPEEINGIRLHITRVENLSILEGLGDYADIYRQMPTLSETERDILDGIYARGGTDGESLGFLQTLGGQAVNYSTLALHRNLANVRRNIQRRTVDYQREELEEKLSVGSSGYGSLVPKSHELNYSGLWAYIDQTWTNQDDTGAVAGYRYNPYGIGIGYESHRDEWIFGALARYDDGTVKLKSQSATRTEVQSLLVSAYASWASQGYYFTTGLQAGHGWNETASVYAPPGLQAVGRSGDYGTALYGASVETGYMMDGYLWGNNLRITPYGGLGYAHISRDGFNETGTGNLNRTFADNDWGFWDLSLGLRLAMPFEMDNFTLVPSLDAAFVRTMGGADDGKREVSLLAAPGAAWHPAVFDHNRSALNLSGGAAANFKSGLILGADFNFEFRKGALTSQLNLNVGRTF